MVLPTYARTLDFWREFWIQKIKDPKTFWIQDQDQGQGTKTSWIQKMRKPLGSKDTKNLLDPKDTPPPPLSRVGENSARNFGLLEEEKFWNSDKF